MSSGHGQADGIPAWIAQTWGWLRAHGVQAINLIIPVGVVVGEFLVRDPTQRSPGGWILVMAIVALGFLAVALMRTKPTYQELAEKAAESERRGDALETAMAKLLQRISEEHRIHGTTFRASAYYLSDGEFVLVARHSADPVLARPGRKAYPIDQGVIALGWQDPGWHATTKLSEDRDTWLAEMERFGIGGDEARSLTMQSLSIGALRINSKDGGAIGMLVLESLGKLGVNSTTLNQVRASTLFDFLADLIQACAPGTPRVSARAATVSANDAPESEWHDMRPPDSGTGAETP